MNASILLGYTEVIGRHLHGFGRWSRPGRHCQTNVNGPAKGAGPRCSSSQLTPLGQGGSAVLLEDIAAVEVAVVVEVIVD